MYFQSNKCDLDINIFSEHSSKSYRKYIYWKLLYAFHSCFITPFICPTVHLFFYLSAILSVNQSVSLYICFPIYLFPYISVSLYICSSIFLFFHLVIYRLSGYLSSISLSIFLSVRLSVYLHISEYLVFTYENIFP